MDSNLKWAVDNWYREVSLRPLQNVHRAALDTTWRQVIRYFGGDDLILVGPKHHDLVDTKEGQKIMKKNVCRTCGGDCGQC